MRSDWDPITNPLDPLILIDRATRKFKALVAPFDACILNGHEAPGTCINPPRDGLNYEYAHTGAGTAVIPMNLAHADPSWTASAATDYYANTGKASLIGVYTEDDRAIWAEGEISPDLTEWELNVLSHAALSGDWRWINEDGRYRMIASQVVNTPGFRPSAKSRFQATRSQFALTASVTPQSLITTWVPTKDLLLRAMFAAPLFTDARPDDVEQGRVASGKYATKLLSAIHAKGKNNVVHPLHKGL